MTQVNPPPQLKLPRAFIADPQIRAYQEQLQIILLQLRNRTGGDTDDLSELTAEVQQLTIALNENVINTNTNTGDIATINSTIDEVEDKTNELYAARLQNTILINQSTIESVLADPIDSAKVYQLDGIVDLTGLSLNFTIPAGGISITGKNANTDKIRCSDDNYTLFESSVGGSGNIFLQNMEINITGVSSAVYNLEDATGNNAMEVNNVNYIGCTSLGEITGYRQGLEFNTRRSGGKPSLTLSGAWAGGFVIDTSLVRSVTDGAYSLFTAGTAFTMASRFKTNMNLDLPASASMLDFASSNFTNSSTLQLNGCIITRGGSFNSLDTNITPNINAADIACAWSNNVGVANTFEGGRLNITTEVETVITTSSVYYDLLGTYTSSDLQHFDQPSNGQLRHLGQSPVEYKIFSNLNLDGTSGDFIKIAVVIYRDSTTATEVAYEITRIVDTLPGGRDIARFTISTNVILNQNDYVKLQVTNTAATNNVTAELDSYFYVEAR